MSGKRSNKQWGKLLVVGMSALVMVACVGEVRQTPPPDAAAITMAEASISVSGSMRELAAYAAVEQPLVSADTPADPSTYGMGRLVNINYTGPIEPLVNELVANTRYRVQVVGLTPTLSSMVSISRRDASIGDVLRDVNLQAGDKAYITIYPDIRVVELAYR